MRHFVLTLTLTGLLLTIGCTSSTSSSTESEHEEGAAATDCVEPENPYNEGTGHYAGYQWAEEKGTGVCSGSSESFNEGCEEYEQQESEYETCQARKKN